MKKRSFFERLTGSVNIDDEELQEEEIVETRGINMRDVRDTRTESRDTVSRFGPKNRGVLLQEEDRHISTQLTSQWMEEPAGEGELSLDVYQTPDEIIVRAMIPGVRKEDIDISISRDTITIKGNRKEDKTIADDNYVVRELYWGAFTRTVRLPHEVDIEHAEASESQGLLTIKLPRVDKDRQAKLRIKSV
jgi:HSP20 family protein